MARTRKQAVRKRSGFTLIELLVVIAIIGILISLTAVAVFRTIGTQQTSNTRTELTKLDAEFIRQYRAAATKYASEAIPDVTPGNVVGNAYNASFNVVVQMAGNDRERARVIWTKLRLKQTFPNTFNEALNPGGGVVPLPPLPDYQTTLSALGYTTANTTIPQPWESSVCLLIALGRGTEGGGVTVETLGVNSFINEFGPTPSGQTVKGLVDGWRKPIVYSRWPVLSTQLNPTGAQLGPNHDTGDPHGLLASSAWQSTAGYAQFKALFHDVPAHPLTNPPTEAKSYRIYPLIISSGLDGKLGLDPITFQTLVVNDAADDLYPVLAPAQ